MKNMKKFITLCGFLVLGSIACGDADVVKAEAINEQTTDTSGYTITIPSEVSFSTDTTNFDISAGLDKSTQIIITASSQNGFNLTNRDDTIPYSISDNLITLSNSRPDINNTVSQSLNVFIDKSKSPMYGGDYKDTLTFNIQEKQLYTLDVNGLLDGNTVSWLNGYGTFGIKINGRTISNLTDFYQSQTEGTTYEIFNIKATDGKHYIGDTIIKGTFDSPYQRINLKFDTNKLTLNYHTDGAQTWHHFDNITYDVSGKDTASSETRLFGSYYDEKSGLGDVSRLTKKGYTAKPNTWVVGKNGTKEVIDTTGLAKSQDVAEYCGVLDEFKKNDTTIDLYPIWTANTYTLTVNPNGGLINGDGSSKVLDPKLCFDTGNCCDINYLKPTRKGFEFLGWYDAPENGNIVYDSNGKCINNGNYWKDSSYVNPNNLTVYAQWEKAYSAGDTLDIEGTKYVVLEQKENNQALVMTADSIGQETFQSKFRSDGQNENTYEGSYIDNYLENDWYNSLSSTMKTAIRSTNIKQASYATPNAPDSKQETGYNGQVYNTISRHAFLPSVSELGKVVDFNNPDKVKAFTGGWDMWTRDSYQGSHNDVECLVPDNGGLLNGDAFSPYSVRPAFVVDLSQVNYSVVIKGSTSGGTGGSGGSEGSGGTVTTPSELKVLDIEGTKYVVLEERENNQALVLTADSIGNKSFSRGYRDGVKQNTYEGSMIDNYLENEWYNGLSSTMKAAIQTTNIKQASYAIDTDPDSKQETDTNGQVYNTISRHVFLPSVSEIGKVVDLKNPDKVKAFLKGISIWTRDSNQGATSDAECLYANDGCLYGYKVRNAIGVRPSFVIDLSKVNYTVTGTVNYK